MTILPAGHSWTPHNGTAQKRRQRRQFIRPILKSTDPQTIKTREWLRAQSEDEAEFEEFVAMTLYEALAGWDKTGTFELAWTEAVTEMVGDV